MREVIGFVSGCAVYYCSKDSVVTVPALNVIITGCVTKTCACVQCHRVFVNFREAK